MKHRPFTLHGALVDAAAAHPDRPAVVAGGASMTYADLAERAARMARRLDELGVAPGDRVAVWAPKSPDVVAAQYGIMLTGAAYVPVDPLSPVARARRVIDDAGAVAVCADASKAGLLADDGGRRVAVVGLDGATEGVTVGAAEVAAADPLWSPRGCENDLAYLLYTSGSTGAPKGVMLTHRNALSFVEWAVQRFGIGGDDVLSSVAPFHFDLSVFDLYAAALVAAPVHLLAAAEARFGASLAAFIRSARITVWYSVPSTLAMLAGAASQDDLRSLRRILFAGEVFPTRHLRALRDLVSTATLANLYGPTETNVCTYYVVPEVLPADDETIPIGRGCENLEVFALDDDGRTVGAGAVGELWVRGPTVMKGYWGDPDKTARSLSQNPLHDRFPDPVYRTGDLVRPLPGGDLQFLGRRDHQVKSRGYRIELGEIEAALSAHPDVGEAAVVAVADDRIGHALVAYVAAANVDPLALKRHCADRLPRYMIPGTINVLGELPHTSTGKIDRQDLGRRAGATAC